MSEVNNGLNEKLDYSENKKALKPGQKIEQTSTHGVDTASPKSSQFPVSLQDHKESITNLQDKQSIIRNLSKIKIDTIEPREFLIRLKTAFKTPQDSDSVYIKNRIDKRNYILRLSNHSINSYYALKKTPETSIVIKLSEHDFVNHKDRLVKEYVYYPENLTKEVKDNIIRGLTDWVNTGTYSYDQADKINMTDDMIKLEMRKAERAQFVQNKLSEAGIEVVTDKNEFDAIISEKADGKKMTQGSKIYGFSYHGKIYLNSEIATSETPLHEYTHLWDNYIQNTNPELWEKGKNILRNTKFWEEVKADPNYAEIAEDEDLLLSEVHAQICGKMADAILAKIQEQDGELTKNTVIDWNNETWVYIVQEFRLENLWNNEIKETLENLKEFLSRPMKNLFENTEKLNINEVLSERRKTEELDNNEIKEQAEYIEKQFKNTENWLKAPNGKLSKLSPEQWVQVRTPAFKRWFGNWELKNKTFNLVETEKAEFNNKAAAMDWAEKNIIGSMSNDETNGKGEINISNKSVDEMLNLNQRSKSTSNEVHYAALTKLREIIHDSEIVDSHPDFNKDENGHRTPLAGINKDVNIDVLYGAMRFEGEVYRVKTTVKRFIDKNAKSKAYAYDVQKIEVLPGIADNSITATVSKGSTSILGDILLQGVRKVNQETGDPGELALEAYSKVLDENGEPLVVYHGSDKQFDVFHTEKSPAFFSQTKDYAESMAEERNGNELYATFLNIRNCDVIELPENEFSDPVIEKPFVENAKLQGKDGIIFTCKTDNELLKDSFYAVFKPNQIKSATDNNGNFDLKNDSILFQIIGEKGAAALDKTEEATTRLDNLKIAQKMTEVGKDAKTIRLATGWERGADGNWRYEIDDSKVNFYEEDRFPKRHLVDDEEFKKIDKAIKESGYDFEKINIQDNQYWESYIDSENEYVRQFIDFENGKEVWKKAADLERVLNAPELFKAYPELKHTQFKIEKLPSGTSGEYRTDTNTIVLDESAGKSVLLHEIQHTIQYIEGFATGGNEAQFKAISIEELENKRTEINKKIVELEIKYFSTEEWLELDKKLSNLSGEEYKNDKREAVVYQIENLFANKEDSDEYKKLCAELDSLNDRMEEIKENALDGQVEIDGNLYANEYEAYRSLSGEVEARNVQTRMNMTPEERLNTPLSETEDVAQEDQIVMFDGTVAASKITSRSQYLEGKTELTDEDIIHLLDFPPEIENRTQIKSYTDKGFTDYDKDSEPLSQLTEKLKNDPEYLLYRGSYIAKSKLLYEQSVILCNEIPSLIIGQAIKESFYLLPYGYAKDKEQNYKKFADILDKNVFTDIKRNYSESIRNNFKKAHKQGNNVFFLISNKTIGLEECLKELKKCVYNRKNVQDKTAKYFCFFENTNKCLTVDFNSIGNIHDKKIIDIDLKQLKLPKNGELQVVRGRMQSTPSGTFHNITHNEIPVNDFFNSLLLRGELEMIRNHEELQKDLTIYQKCFAELEQLTNQTQSELLKSSNLSFIQSEKDSQFYKDLIEDKNRNTALNTTKGEEKTMETENELSREEILDQGIEQIQANGGMSEAAMEADIAAESLDSFFFDETKDDENIMSEQEIAKAEEAYREWEEMLEDNQKAEEIIEKNQAREPSESAQEIATNFVLEKLQQAGIEVITDESAMKSILDAGKEVQKMAAHYGTSQNIEGPNTFSGYGAYVVSLNKENAKELGLKIASKKYGNNFYIGNQSFPEFLNDRNFSQYWQTVLRQVSDNPTVEMLSNEIAFTDTKGNASLEKEQAQLETLFNLNLISYKREQTYLYSVEIPDDNGTNYLIYDKSIGKENADRINSELKRLGTNWSVTRNDTGKNVYFNLLSEKVFHSQKLSSEFLQKIGFVGMETTNQNYIIFDDREMYINNRVQYMMTENGEVYGFAYNGKIYADKELMNSNVLAHEYTHLWDNYTRLTNKDLWERGIDIFRQTHLWEEIRNDPAYQDIRNNDDEILSECHARICGEIAQKVLERIAEKDGKSLRAEVIDWNQEVNRYISEELMIKPELGNENYISDTIKQEFLQQFLSMPMKDLMKGVGYEKDTFIKEIQNSMYHTKEWSENFPKVYSHSLYYGDSVNDKNYSENVKTALLVGKAKRGDRDAAIDLVNQSVRPEIIKELHQKYPDAIVCAVDGLEANGHNMIPILYQQFLKDQGFYINETIIQSAKAHHTGADNLDKLLNRVRFSGEVQKGKDYILLDDHISMGSTLRDLRDYIESNGGNVVAITTLTAPEQDYKISISKENFEKLSVYGEPLNEFLREYGITDNIKGLTDREASEILGLLSDRGRNPETQEGIRRSASLRCREIQENYLKQQTQSQSLINPQKLVKQNSEEVVNLPSILSLAKTEHEELNLYGSSGGKLILDFKENPDAFCQLTGLDKEPYFLQSKGEPFTAEIHVRKNQEGKLLVDALIPDLNSTTLRLVNLENLLEKNGKEYSSELLSLLEERLMNRQEEKTQIQEKKPEQILQDRKTQKSEGSLSAENKNHEDIEIKPLSGIFDSMMKSAIERGDLGTEERSENIEKKAASESEKKDKPKVDYIKKGAMDFLKAVENGTAPFLDKNIVDFGKITIEPREILNAQTGRAFSGQNQLLSQIYAKEQEMQSLIVTSMEGAKKAGTYIAKKDEAKKNYVLAFQKDQKLFHSRFFEPGAAENPNLIYSKFLEKQRPLKLKSLRECVVHYSRSAGDYDIANKYYQEIAKEHLKNIQAYIAVPDGKKPTIKDLEASRELLKNYFEFENVPEKERTFFEETYGILIDVEKERPVESFSAQSIETEIKKQQDFLMKNTFTETELGEYRKKEFEETVEQMQKEEKEQIDARGITEPEAYLGRYLAACSSNSEFVTDEKTIETVSKKLSENLKRNFQVENYEIIEEIGSQAAKIASEMVNKMSFDKAHSNDVKQAVKQDNNIKHPPVGMGGK